MALSATQSQLLVNFIENAVGKTPASFLTPFVNQPPAKQKVLGALAWVQTPAIWTDLVAQLALAATLEDLLADPKRLQAEMGKDTAAKIADEHAASTRSRNAAIMKTIEEQALAEQNMAARGGPSGKLDLGRMAAAIPSLNLPPKHPASI